MRGINAECGRCVLSLDRNPPVHARVLRLYIAHAHHPTTQPQTERSRISLNFPETRGTCGQTSHDPLPQPPPGRLTRARILLSTIRRTQSCQTLGHAARVQVGLDVLEAQKFAPLRGKHVGLITNHTGLDSQGRSTLTFCPMPRRADLVALFSPEHGLAGHDDEKVSSSQRHRHWSSRLQPLRRQSAAYR